MVPQSHNSNSPPGQTSSYLEPLISSLRYLLGIDAINLADPSGASSRSDRFHPSTRDGVCSGGDKSPSMLIWRRPFTVWRKRRKPESPKSLSRWLQVKMHGSLYESQRRIVTSTLQRESSVSLVPKANSSSRWGVSGLVGDEISGLSAPIEICSVWWEVTEYRAR